MKLSLIDNREIRVFISSTFYDMQDERSELVRKTFPRLRALAAARDVTLTEVDLRWGITKEESESGKVIEICLREVENSIPFFLGIIGNRYGWIPEPKDISDIVRERFPVVHDDYVKRHLSATEIEIQFGVLDRTDVDMNAYFFIKEEKDAVDDSEQLTALKKAVRENKKYPVSKYSTPEDLASQVLAAFTKLLDDLFPEGELSPLEKERLGQRAFLNSLCRVYIGNESNFAVIDEWMRDWEKHQLVITGESGLGKSALVANWVRERLTLAGDSPYRVAYHFVGNGGCLGSEAHVVKALCDEIRDQYRVEGDDLDDLFDKVAAEGDKPLLIVLDGINQVVGSENVKRLNWLPVPPRNVKILFTTLEDDETMRVFKERRYPVFTLQHLNKEERIRMVEKYLHKVYRKKLTADQLERIVDDPQNENTLVLKTLLDELANFGDFKKLDEKIEEYLRPDSYYDFYQVVLENYEANFGETLVREYLSLVAVSRSGLSEEEILEMTSTKDKPILWSQFYCSFRQHMIVKNGLISFSHGFIRGAVEGRYLHGHDDWINTCRERIVFEFIDKMDSEGGKTTRSMDEVPYQLDLLEDMTRLHDYLINPISFSYLYMSEKTTLGRYWRKLLDTGDYSLEEYLAHMDLIKEHVLADVLYMLSAFTRDVIVNPSLSIQFAERSLACAEDEETRAKSHYLLAGAHRKAGNYQKALEHGLLALEIRTRIFGENHPDVATAYSNVGVTYRIQRDFQKSLEYGLKALAIRQALFGEEHPKVATSYNNVGVTYGKLGDHQKEMEYKLKALEIRKRFFGEESTVVATSYNNLGITYRSLGYYQKEMECIQKALEIKKSIFGEEHPDVATAYNNVGYAYSDLEDYLRALEYKLRALEIWRRIFGENHPDVATAYNNVGVTYGKLGDHQKEMEYLLKALEIRKMVFGEAHPSVAMSYNNIGVTYGELGDHQKAQEYYSKAQEIKRKLDARQTPKSSGE